jgi:4-amino-4-deoxy-L-arabinose transferase-like glycosyltransferase
MINVIALVKQSTKLFTKKQWILLFAILLLFGLTRLIKLDGFPIFSDEGIYIRWAKVAWKDATWRFISLTDGRQPLQTWATIPFLKLFESNALLAGRLFPVSAGFIALIGIMSLGRYLFGAPTALIAGFLYVITPYFLFYDRIALVDSAVNASTVWIFLLSIILARTRRLDIALILGFVSGFALLAKSSIRLYVGLALAAAVFIMWPYESNTIKGYIETIKGFLFKAASRAQKLQELFSFFVLYLISVSLAILIYNVQRLSPFLHFVEEKNKTFILTKQELFANPFDVFSHNILNIPYYIFSETGFIVAALGLVGLFLMYRRHKTEAMYFTIWLTTAYIAISFVARVLFPRYVLSLGGLLLIPAAYLIANMRTSRQQYVTLGLVLLSVVYFNYTIMFDYAKIPFPQIDRGQYLEGWPAGWGAKEIMLSMREASQTKPVLIVAEGNFGMSHDVLDTFLIPGDQIRIQPYWPLDKTQLEEHQKDLATSQVFVVFAHKRGVPADWPVELVQRYDKPGDESELLLYRLLPASPGFPNR